MEEEEQREEAEVEDPSVSLRKNLMIAKAKTNLKSPFSKVKRLKGAQSIEQIFSQDPKEFLYVNNSEDKEKKAFMDHMA